MSTSPTQLTLAKLRADGYTCAVTEHWNAFAKIRQDLFGFADIIAIQENLAPLLVQCTTQSNVAARKKKILENAIAPIWATIGRIEVWGWKKVKSKWSVSITWYCKDTGKFSEIPYVSS